MAETRDLEEQTFAELEKLEGVWGSYTATLNADELRAFVFLQDRGYAAIQKDTAGSRIVRTYPQASGELTALSAIRAEQARPSVTDEQILHALKSTNGPDGVPLVEWLEVPNEGDAQNWGIPTHGWWYSDIRGDIHDDFHVKLMRALLSALAPSTTTEETNVGIEYDDGAVIVRWKEGGKDWSLTALCPRVGIFDGVNPAYHVDTTTGALLEGDK